MSNDCAKVCILIGNSVWKIESTSNYDINYYAHVNKDFGKKYRRKIITAR